MKSALIGLLVIVLIGGGVGGTWYYMDMQVKAANERTNAAQAETSAAKTQTATLEAELKAKADMELATQALLTSFETFSLMTGSGKTASMLETYYDNSVIVEWDIDAQNLRTYALALQKYWKSLTANEGVVTQPIQVTNGEWTAVVQLLEKNSTEPLTLSQSGTLLTAPSRLQKEIVLVLAKWKDGKIVEQYEFPYAGDVAKSKLLDYIPSLSSTNIVGSGTTSASSVKQDDTLIENTPSSVPVKVKTGSGTTPDAA